MCYQGTVYKLVRKKILDFKSGDYSNFRAMLNITDLDKEFIKISYIIDRNNVCWNVTNKY